MSEKRRGLGRGLGALIPTSPVTGGARPVDVFFPGQRTAPAAPDAAETQDERDSAADGAAGPAEAPATQGDQSEGRPDADAPDAAAAGPGDSVDHGVDDGGLRPVPGATYAELPIDAIRPNPRQPRTVFDEDDMAELVHSISEIGVLQPIVVRPLEEADNGIGFELIMGERRWRASKEAGIDTVPAIVKATDDDALLRDALLENLHRSQLNPLEEAAAYQQLLEDFQCTQEELASRIGRSRPQVSNTLRLLKLPPLVARRVAAGVLSAGHARALLTLDDGASMERLAQRIVAEGLSVRSVEEIVALGGDEERPRRRRPRPGSRHPQLDDLSAEIGDRLDTRVGISLGQRKGKMTIEFASMEDLNRILDILGLRS
ncbi:MAG TPA: ParB/RepB/Spo0J family partition protein [Intrasporangiaceae bacterium]|nr:ParB/RepB/Spo0J family partition protein [Intrasporangiaceae bacterium]